MEALNIETLNLADSRQKVYLDWNEYKPKRDNENFIEILVSVIFSGESGLVKTDSTRRK